MMEPRRALRKHRQGSVGTVKGGTGAQICRGPQRHSCVTLFTSRLVIYHPTRSRASMDSVWFQIKHLCASTLLPVAMLSWPSLKATLSESRVLTCIFGIAVIASIPAYSHSPAHFRSR